jgi:hypothetical protein
MTKRQFPGRRLAAGLFLCSSLAAAAPPGAYDAPNYVSYKRPPPERRAGFTVGVNWGLGLGAASAYPNDAGEIGDPAFRESTGVGLDNQLSVWLGGALRDWLTVGVGFAMASARGRGLLGTNIGPLFKVEGFPFFPMGGPWQNLGFSADLGLGVGTIVDPNQSGDPLAGGGATSQVALTAFYEPFRFWAASSGPSLTYAHGVGQIYSHHQILVGWRFVIYSGQPKRKKVPRKEEAATHRWGVASW